MSVKKSEYLNDGAGRQARGVLPFVNDNIESSYNDGKYQSNIQVGRWENCREQGYVVSVCGQDHRRQLNIAFFEHRNSDELHAIKWEQLTLNTPTIDNLPEDHSFYKNKYDTDKRVSYGEVLEMANWINSELEYFWKNSLKLEKHGN